MRASRSRRRTTCTASAPPATSTRCSSCPDGSLRLIVQGLARVTLDEVIETQPYLRARVQSGAGGVRRQRSSRDRRAAAQHQDELPAGRVAVAAALGRSADAGRQHHRARPARRLHRLEPDDHRHAGEAGGARDARRARADGHPEPHADQGARGARARLEDPVAGAVRGRQEPARVLPARADEGDPEGARRGRRPDQGSRGAAAEDRSGGHARDGQEGSAARARSAVEDAGGRRRIHRVAHLSRLARHAAVAEARRGGDRPAADEGDARRRSLRPREGEGSHPRVPGRPQAESRA